MKATGIVRRVDDLGRIVIPKEIRRTLRIREGDPLLKNIDRDRTVLMGHGAAPKEIRRALKMMKLIRRFFQCGTAVSGRQHSVFLPVQA